MDRLDWCSSGPMVHLCFLSSMINTTHGRKYSFCMQLPKEKFRQQGVTASTQDAGRQRIILYTLKIRVMMIKTIYVYVENGQEVTQMCIVVIEIVH